MGLTITEKTFELANEGLHTVVISSVEDLGLQETDFGMKERVRITFTVLDQKDAEGNPIKLFLNATQSIGAKSTLGKFLRQLGVNVQGEFNMDEILGLQIQVVVEHNKSAKNGKTYANIATVLKKHKSSGANAGYEMQTVNANEVGQLAELNELGDSGDSFDEI